MIDRLQTRDFRCFPQASLELDAGWNWLVGPNAQGKTSLLEACCILLRLTSPRASRLADCIRHGSKGFVLDGYAHDAHLQFYFSPSRKKLALDSVEQKSAADYLGVGRVVIFSNDDIQLLRGGADGRRKFLDFLGVQIFPDYRRTLRAYEHALRSRNRLLKQPVIPWRQVEAFDPGLIENGDALTAMRRELIERLALRHGAACADIAGPGCDAGIEYLSGCTGDLRQALADLRDEDARLRVTTAGPHRDDLALRLDGKPAASFASEGQQRTMVIGLRLAEARLIQESRSQLPVFLIDDVFGELDPARRNALIRSLPETAQKIVTTTTLNWLDSDPGGKRFRIDDGIHYTAAH